MTSRSRHLIKETQVSVFISVQPHIPSCSCVSPSVSICGWAQVRLLSSVSALSSARTQAAVPWVSLALSLLSSVVSYSDGEKCISPICGTQLTVRFSLCRPRFRAVLLLPVGTTLSEQKWRGASCGVSSASGQDSTHFPCCSRLCLFPQSPSKVLFHRSTVWSAWFTALWTPSSLWFLKCAFKFACNQIPIIVLWSFWLKYHNKEFSFPKIPHTSLDPLSSSPWIWDIIDF